jgi:uncharacterized protein (DUF1778 family)
MKSTIQLKKTLEVVEYARLNCRVSARIKHDAEKAASLLGQSITDFTESALAEKAQIVLGQHERITLSERDFAIYVASLESPAAPTPALRTAIHDYRLLKAANPEANF